MPKNPAARPAAKSVARSAPLVPARLAENASPWQPVSQLTPAMRQAVKTLKIDRPIVAARQVAGVVEICLYGGEIVRLSPES